MVGGLVLVVHRSHRPDPQRPGGEDLRVGVMRERDVGSLSARPATQLARPGGDRPRLGEAPGARRADQLRLGPALQGQLERLRVVANGDRDLGPLRLQTPGDRSEEQRVRGVGEVDPDLQRSPAPGSSPTDPPADSHTASSRLSASSIGACTQRTCGVRLLQTRVRWKTKAPSSRPRCLTA